jgi:hypothetical protein
MRSDRFLMSSKALPTLEGGGFLAFSETFVKEQERIGFPPEMSCG